MMIVASTTSKNKIFHYPSCKYAANIKPNNRIVFNNKDEARRNGYTHCAHCSRILKYYEEDKEDIDDFIFYHNLSMYIEDDSIFLENTFSSWKITVESNGYGLVLYHGNAESYRKLEKKNGHIIHHYHKQRYKGTRDILSMLDYIIDHDNWRVDRIKDYKKMPKSTKRKRREYRKARKKAIRIGTMNLYNLIDKVALETDNKNGKAT